MSFQSDAVSYRRRRSALKSVLMSSSALLAASGISATTSAQEVTELEGITIYSANRTPTDAAKVGSTVNIVTEQDIRDRSQTYVKDYLDTIPGISFSQYGPPGSAATLNVRGATTQYVKVLIDGMDLSDPSSTQQQMLFENLLVNDVSRIEVLKGSQSILYGGDAVAGVVSIDTRTALKPGFSQFATAEYGRYNTWNGAYSAGYASDRGNISFTVQGVNTDGFSTASVGTEDDGYRNVTLSGRGEYKLSDAVSIFFAARSLDAHNEYDDYESVPPYAFGDYPAYGDTEQQAGRVGANINLLGGQFQNTIAVQGMKTERDTFDTFGYNTYEGDRVKAEYKGVLSFNNRLSLLFGSDWEQLGVKVTKSASWDPDLPRKTVDITGAYAQLMMEPIDGLVLTGGGRIDDHSDFGDFDTYRFTAAYLVPGTETKFRGSISTGYRAPSLWELYSPQYGSSILTPESSKSWDAGIDQGFLQGRVKASVTYFELDTDNYIDFVWNGMGYQYANVPGVTHRNGVELSAVAQLLPNLWLTGGYTYVDTEKPNGARLSKLPRNIYLLGLDAKPLDKLSVNVTARFVEDTIEGTAPLDDYVLVSAKIGYEFMPGVTAYVRGENLLDEKYETVRGYGTAGASVYGGFTMALPN